MINGQKLNVECLSNMIGAFIMSFAACRHKITWLDFLRRMQNESNYGRQTKGCWTPQNESKKDEAKFMRKDLAKLVDEQVVQKIAKQGAKG